MHQSYLDVERWAVGLARMVEHTWLDGMIAKATDTTLRLGLCAWHCVWTSYLDRLVAVEDTSCRETGRVWTGLVHLHSPEALVAKVPWPKEFVVDMPMAWTKEEMPWAVNADWV
jgi:hypothetical protein